MPRIDVAAILGYLKSRRWLSKKGVVFHDRVDRSSPRFSENLGRGRRNACEFNGLRAEREVLSGNARSPRNEMFWRRRGDRAARVGEWKWVDSQRGSGLYNLATDISEQTDLSKEQPDVLQMVRDRYDDWERRMEEAEPRGPFREY